MLQTATHKGGYLHVCYRRQHTRADVPVSVTLAYLQGLMSLYLLRGSLRGSLATSIKSPGLRRHRISNFPTRDPEAKPSWSNSIDSCGRKTRRLYEQESRGIRLDKSDEALQCIEREGLERVAVTMEFFVADQRILYRSYSEHSFTRNNIASVLEPLDARTRRTRVSLFRLD